MCEFFVKADPILYEQRTRTIRIHGVLTSIRLENMVWDTLAEMAAAEDRTTNALIVQLHDEIVAHRGEVPNFASFLRVTCMRFMRRQIDALQAHHLPSDERALRTLASVPGRVRTAGVAPVVPQVAPHVVPQVAPQVLPLAARR